MRLSFPNPEPRLKTLLSIVTECSKWGLFTRPLTQNWGRGRIQLVGDAAHAMLPNAGQGACQAFEDAYILARWLDACRDPVEAFANFRRIRIPRVHGVQRLALSNARFKHMRDAAAQKQSIAAGKGSVHGNADWVWGYEPMARMEQGAFRSHRLRRLIVSPYFWALISSNLAVARWNWRLNSHIASRISRNVAEVFARSAFPNANMLLLRRYPMMRGVEIR